MGSPITFSGFNNIDFGVVLNAIMQQERAPIAAIEAQRTALRAQNTAFSTLATRLGSLKTAVSALAGSDNVSKISATSSDDAAVGISTGAAAVTGRYEVVVSELARAQVMASQTTYASSDAVVATAGAINLARFGQPPIEIPLNGPITLEDLASAINEHPDSPVNASVVQVAPGQYRLVLTGRSTGTANGFTVGFSTPLSGGQGLTFGDTDGNGISGDTAADNVQSASDAQLTVNQVPVTSSSNILQDVVDGVTLTLRRKDPDATVVVDVTKDHEATAATVEEFATAYNALVAFMGEQTSAANGQNGIGRDPLMRSLRDSLRAALLGAAPGGTFTRLPEVGITFDTTGKIVIEKPLLTAALERNTADVGQLFADRFQAIESMISSYTDSGGLVADVRQRNDAQLARLGARIDVLEQQLVLRRASLQREFIAADRAMSQLNNQGSSLGQLAGQYRLF
jgi:flagellar hook-associated protein 2